MRFRFVRCEHRGLRDACHNCDRYYRQFQQPGYDHCGCARYMFVTTGLALLGPLCARATA